MQDTAANVSGKQTRMRSPALLLRQSVLLNTFLSHLSAYQLSATWLLNIMKKDISLVCVCVCGSVRLCASPNVHVRVSSNE